MCFSREVQTDASAPITSACLTKIATRVVETDIEDSGHEYTEPNLLRLLKRVRSQCPAQGRRQQPHAPSDCPYTSTRGPKEPYVSAVAKPSSDGRAPSLVGKSYTAFMAGSSIAMVISPPDSRCGSSCFDSRRADRYSFQNSERSPLRAALSNTVVARAAGAHSRRQAMSSVFARLSLPPRSLTDGVF